MKNIVFILSLFITPFLSAQEASPPLPVTPTTENRILIDELIKVTGYEKYVNDYCIDKISQAAQDNNWDEKKKQEITKSIHFEQFTDIIYNTFALYSKEELQNLIKAFERINQNKQSIKLIPISDTIQHNLEGFATDLIKGDYLFLNK